MFSMEVDGDEMDESQIFETKRAKTRFFLEGLPAAKILKRLGFNKL
jgi:hypothetical protein